MQQGFVFNIQRYSLHDGPGIRTTVFLKGCPLRCLWCHNPEGISAAPEVITVESRCVACGECVKACPVGLPNSISDHGQLCRVCGACVEACPTGARQQAGRSMDTAELTREILKDRVFYDDSGGGVTFSGGEPMAQFEFLHEMLAICRRHGVHSAVDTSGLCPWKDLLAVAPLADLFLFDIKGFDPVRHADHTGVGNASILENLQALSGVHRNIWIRMPIVPELTDDPQMLKSAAEYIKQLPGITRVSLLPYHKTGMVKFRRLGKSSAMPEVDTPAGADLERAALYFSSLGLPVTIGG